MRATVVITAALVLSLLSAPALAQKLYRWVDAEGKVHYTDTLPTGRFQRAEERAAKAAEEAEAERLAAIKAEQDKMDAVLMGSYATEEDLERAYRERFDLLDQSLEAARVGIRSQEKSLEDQLDHAASLERAGRPVPATVQSTIAAARKQVEDQREYLSKRETERKDLQTEYDTVLQRYRILKEGG